MGSLKTCGNMSQPFSAFDARLIPSVGTLTANFSIPSQYLGIIKEFIIIELLQS